MAALSLLATAHARTALFWLVPYRNLTSVDAYSRAWRQWGEQGAVRRQYIMAGSAYALKPDGSLGYADTTFGEGLHGDLMERYGFPALKAMGLKTIAMVYVTHEAAIQKMVASPQSFIDELLAKARVVGLDGFDIDYEPQGRRRVSAAASAGDIMGFISQLAAAAAKAKLILTVDIENCSPWMPNGAFSDFDCDAAVDIPGLLQVNTMSTFNSRSLSDFKMAASHQSLGAKWAPGFEPANLQKVQGAAFREITDWMARKATRQLATWQLHENNVGAPQPQWLFDTVNAFLLWKPPALTAHTWSEWLAK
jgi:hypothetical protein